MTCMYAKYAKKNMKARLILICARTYVEKMPKKSTTQIDVWKSNAKYAEINFTERSIKLTVKNAMVNALQNSQKFGNQSYAQNVEKLLEL